QSYVIRHITARRVDQAYPLVMLKRPHLTLDAWRQFCAGRMANRGQAPRPPAGVLLALDRAGYVRGLCSYEIDGRPRKRPALRIDILAFAHLFAFDAILDRMLDELGAIAASFGCGSMEIDEDDCGA